MTTSINHNWMSYLSDNKPIREISIPGTHDSATSAYKPGYLSHKIVATPWVKTQDDNIRDQLNKGVRFLDIRCRHLNNSFVIHHASFYCFCSFEDVLNMIVDFLKKNTSEFILMRIRNEHKESNNNRSFCETMQTYYDTHREFFWQPGHNNDPNLGDVRGKIVILQNWNGQISFGIKYHSFDIQDKYEVNWISNKILSIDNHLNEAKNSKKNIINYLSGVGSIKKLGLPTPRQVAKNTNTYMCAYLNKNPSQYVGIIPADFPSHELLTLIIWTNFTKDQIKMLEEKKNNNDNENLIK